LSGTNKLTNLDIFVAVFGIRERGRVDLWIDIVIDIVSDGGFCNKIVNFVFDLKGKTYAKLTFDIIP